MSLSIEDIKDYLIEVGCKVEYPTLVNAFKHHLCNKDPTVQNRVRTQFKDYVNTLATVTLENNMKYINLKPEFHKPRLVEITTTTTTKQNPNKVNNSAKPPSRNMQTIANESTFNSSNQKSLTWNTALCTLDCNLLQRFLKDDPSLALKPDSSNGYTALHWAAKFNNLKVIQMMIDDYGLPVNVKSFGGFTPLHLACMYSKHEARKLLISYGADTKIRDNGGKLCDFYLDRVK